MTHPYSIDWSLLLPPTGLAHGAMGKRRDGSVCGVVSFGTAIPLNASAGSLRPSTGVLGCVVSECNPRLETTDRDEVDEVRHG